MALDAVLYGSPIRDTESTAISSISREGRALRLSTTHHLPPQTSRSGGESKSSPQGSRRRAAGLKAHKGLPAPRAPATPQFESRPVDSNMRSFRHQSTASRGS